MSTLQDDLKRLSSAEDFFAYFDVPYEPRIMAACRLHILKRFHDHLDGGTLDTLDAEAQRTAYRTALKRAYDEFTSAPALARGAFPRLRSVRGAFVALSALRPPRSGI